MAHLKSPNSEDKFKVKVKVTLEQARKAQRGVEL
jgi:hypothetical protein